MSKSSLIREGLVELPNNWLGHCFGCSPKNPDGLQMKILMSKDGCISYINVPEKFCGFEGLVHGGIIATLLDEIAAWTLLVHIKKLCLTQEAQIKYFRPVHIDTPLVVEGKIKDLSKHEVTTLSYVKNIDGKILAECESRWVIPDLQTLAKITGKDETVIKHMYENFINPIDLIKRERI